MKIPGLRWWVIVLIFLAAVLNYVDRQTLSALAPTIQADLAMDDHAYADVVNFFLVPYTLSYLVAGKLADKVGTGAWAEVRPLTVPPGEVLNHAFPDGFGAYWLRLVSEAIIVVDGTVRAKN